MTEPELDTTPVHSEGPEWDAWLAYCQANMKPNRGLPDWVVARKREALGGFFDPKDFNPSQPRDDQGRFAATGGGGAALASGDFRIENGVEHAQANMAPINDSLNFTADADAKSPLDYHLRRPQDGEGDLTFEVHPDSRHSMGDVSGASMYERGKGAHFVDTSPDNPAGLSQTAMTHWSTPGSKSVWEKGGTVHHAEIRDGAARQLGLPVTGTKANGVILNPKTPEQYEAWGKNMTNSIDKAPAAQPTLWRGVHGEHGAALMAMKPDEEFDLGLSSTSRDVNAASSYGSEAMLRIRPGAKGVAERKHLTHDQEVVTQGKFKVLRVDSGPAKDIFGKDFTMTVISVEQVGTYYVP